MGVVFRKAKGILIASCRTNKKWVRSEADGRAVSAGCYFDELAGKRVCDFFEKLLRHSKGKWAGKPFELMAWQRDDLLMPLFGWKRADGTRRYRVGYVEIPKKNGKSTLCAGLSLYGLIGDGERGAEVYNAAADRQQASIVFNEAAKMVRSSPALAKRLEVIDSRKTIAFMASGSTYRALAADADSNEGLNVSTLIFDELHAQKNPKLWDALRYGGATRDQPLLIAITTAGVDRHSIAWEQHEYAEKVISGAIQDDSYFAYVRAASPDDDWTKPETWRKANPSLGVTISEEDFAKDCEEAQRVPRKENPFKRYRLNLWTEQVDRWLQMNDWDACADPVDEARLAGRECVMALDLSTKIDLSAVVLLFPPTEADPLYRVLPRFWVPADNAGKREERDRVPYPAWIRDGHLNATDGNVIDYDFIKSRILDDCRKFVVKEVAYDPWNATQIALQLQGEGLSVVEFGQGFRSMSEPTKELEKLVLQKKIAHGGHPVLRWMASNVAIEQDAAGNLKPSKKKSTERIDGIVTLVMALGRCLVGEKTAASVYETRGLITL